jgi:hypothetical protein
VIRKLEGVCNQGWEALEEDVGGYCDRMEEQIA